MKKALIIHGFEGTHTGNWFLWIEKELRNRGYEVINKTWPNPAHPDPHIVLPFFDDLTEYFGPDDIIIGHSLGAFWALKVAEKKELGGIFLVAPAIGDLDYDKYRTSWASSDVDSLQKTVEEGFDLSKVKAKAKVAIFSDDDPWVPSSIQELLDDSWKIIELQGRGHIQDSELPELLNEIL